MISSHQDITKESYLLGRYVKINSSITDNNDNRRNNKRFDIISSDVGYVGGGSEDIFVCSDNDEV